MSTETPDDACVQPLPISKCKSATPEPVTPDTDALLRSLGACGVMFRQYHIRVH